MRSWRPAVGPFFCADAEIRLPKQKHKVPATHNASPSSAGPETSWRAISGQNISAMPAKSQHAAGQDARRRPGWPVMTVGQPDVDDEASEEHHRKQSAHQEKGAVVEEDEIRGEEKHAEPGEAQMVGRRKNASRRPVAATHPNISTVAMPKRQNNVDLVGHRPDLQARSRTRRRSTRTRSARRGRSRGGRKGGRRQVPTRRAERRERT